MIMYMISPNASGVQLCTSPFSLPHKEQTLNQRSFLLHLQLSNPSFLSIPSP